MQILYINHVVIFLGYDMISWAVGFLVVLLIARSVGLVMAEMATGEGFQ
jgi:hypothetical protein